MTTGPTALAAPSLSSRCPGRLIAGIRLAVAEHAGWPRTAELVGEQVRRHLPDPDILTARERRGEPSRYQAHLLHVEPDGSFSVLALVWRPGQATAIHDHVAWGAFAVLEGTEREEIFTLTPDQAALTPQATNQNNAGDVSVFAPPGDIHRITNLACAPVTQLHVYGTDVGRLGTSVRRLYDLPVRGPLTGAATDLSSVAISRSARAARRHCSGCLSVAGRKPRRGRREYSQLSL